MKIRNQKWKLQANCPNENFYIAKQFSQNPNQNGLNVGLFTKIHAVRCRSDASRPYYVVPGMVFAGKLEFEKIKMGAPMVRYSFIALTLATTAPATAEEKFKLPPEVTPALRAACESDVRRLCIGEKPTYSKVKRCVMVKFFSLGKRCRNEIQSAGLM